MQKTGTVNRTDLEIMRDIYEKKPDKPYLTWQKIVRGKIITYLTLNGITYSFDNGGKLLSNERCCAQLEQTYANIEKQMKCKKSNIISVAYRCVRIEGEKSFITNTATECC